MKKVSLMLGALALVLGLSQCNKEKSPVQAGEKQYIEVTASNGNDGSKVNVDFASVPTVMNLTWEEGDVITVSGGAVGTLTLDEGAGTAQGHFSGEIEKKNDNELVFSYRKAIPSKDDDVIDFSAQDGTETWIENNLYLETKAAYNESGRYSLQMEMPYAVLMLNLSAFVGTQNDVTIKVGDDMVATVKALKAANAGQVYVAVPADGTEQAYTFSGNDKTGKKTWTLEASTYYTAEGGNAIVIKPTPKFTVGENTTVEFAPGNLYWDGSSWQFEANQWDFRHYNGTNNDAAVIGGESTTTPTGTVGSFFWSKTASVAYASSYSDSGASTSDVFFTNGMQTTANPDFQVNGETAGTWRTLSKVEWGYLLYSRTGASRLRAWVTLSDVSVSGLVILPDGSSATASGITTSSALAGSGAVFLPAAGSRLGTDVRNVGSYGIYWAGAPGGNREDYAYYMKFDSAGAYVDDIMRRYGLAVRLVR